MADDGAQAERQRLPTFRNLPSYRLHLLSALSERHSESVYNRLYDLKLIECRIIGITGGHGEAAFRTICQEAYLEKSYASRLINRLVERGLLLKVDNADDMRSINVALTEEGRRVHAAMHTTAVELNDLWTAVLTPQEKDMLLPLIERLTDRVMAMAQNPELRQEHPGKRTVSPADGASTAAAPERAVALPEPVARQLYDLLGAALGVGGAGDHRGKSVRRPRSER